MANNPTPTMDQRSERLKRLDRWQSWCAFPVLFAGFLFFSKPTSVRAVLIYRVTLIVGGIAGYLILARMKRRA